MIKDLSKENRKLGQKKKKNQEHNLLFQALNEINGHDDWYENITFYTRRNCFQMLFIQPGKQMLTIKFN